MASFANLEMAIVLPLGVVAQQLQKIETELRRLGMRSLNLAQESESERIAPRIEAGLDDINDALDSIKELVTGIEEHMRRNTRGARRDQDD